LRNYAWKCLYICTAQCRRIRTCKRVLHSKDIPSLSDNAITLQRSLEALHSHLEVICKIAGAPDVSLAGSHDGNPIYRANFGFAELQIKEDNTRSTQLAIGIMARNFTVAAVGAVVD
jgi:hypothetical protein